MARITGRRCGNTGKILLYKWCGIAGLAGTVKLKFSVMFFTFAPCISSIKNTIIIPTDAHYYEIIEITLALTCFGSRRNHHQGAVLCLAKATEYGFSVLFRIDVVSVMAAYQPVVQACTDMPP